MLEQPNLAYTYEVRDVAPNILLFGNIGLVQLKEYSVEQIRGLMSKIKANAMCVHLNSAQEMIQTEGDVDFTGCYEKLSELCERVPVIAKGTGNGISPSTAALLKKAGVKGIDVGGFGGTSWVRVEELRSGKKTIFSDQGIPTAASVLYSKKFSGLPVIASGGIRTGLDMAKAIALGADLCGIALPALRWNNKNVLEEKLNQLQNEFKKAMFFTGSKNLKELRKTEIIIKQELADYTQPYLKPGELGR